MKKILIIHTGGTISMEENKETGAVNTSAKHPLTGITELQHMNLEIDEVNLLNIPSPYITMKDMNIIAAKITENKTKYDGFVITHGTDTMEETAYFLQYVVDTEKPVVLTGAMRSSNELGSDAILNLVNAIQVASNEKAKQQGVFVVMNQEIHTATEVTKTSSTAVQAFTSSFGPIGTITKNKVIFKRFVQRNIICPVHITNQNVYLVKAYSDIQPDLLEAIFHLQPNGIVIEGFGQGNLPSNLTPIIKRYIKNEIPVVLTSRCHHGNVQPTYDYDGGGRSLYHLGVWLLNDLSGPKARLKLLIGLAYFKNIEDLKLFMLNE